jgi:hypothetical protein
MLKHPYTIIIGIYLLICGIVGVWWFSREETLSEPEVALSESSSLSENPEGDSGELNLRQVSSGSEGQMAR